MPMTEIYKHVLIVDDSEPDQLIARKIMQITGLAKDVCIKSTYQSAVEYLKNARKHPEDQPDVIFLDINRPAVDGFSFLHVYENMPEDFKHKCRLVILSNTTNRHNTEDIHSYECVSSILPKPLTIDAVLRLSEQVA